MLSAGNNIQSATDTLVPISVEHLFNSLISPRPEIEAKVRQLRIIRQTNEKLYQNSKKLLPYFVCASFNPALRKTENFAYTSYFVLDLDDLAERQQDMLTLRSKVEADPRVMLSFISPSEDGLKLLFKLKDRCYDAGIYKLFYREFSRKFSKQHHLEQVIDSRTCDVCRACFVSCDALAYYNAHAEVIDINEYLKCDDPTALFDLKHEQDQVAATAGKNAKVASLAESTEPEDEALAKIKQVLKVRQQQKDAMPRCPIYVPERLEQIMEGLRVFIEDQGISVYDIQSIQYGKQIRARLGNRLAEINLFYGKHGFRVVQAMKKILSTELNAILAELTQVYLDDNT